MTLTVPDVCICGETGRRCPWMIPCSRGIEMRGQQMSTACRSYTRADHLNCDVENCTCECHAPDGSHGRG